MHLPYNALETFTLDYIVPVSKLFFVANSTISTSIEPEDHNNYVLNWCNIFLLSVSTHIIKNTIDAFGYFLKKNNVTKYTKLHHIDRYLPTYTVKTQNTTIDYTK